jgi:hypothetical protein
MKKILLSVNLCAVFIITGIGIGNTNSITCKDKKLYMSDMYNHVIYEIDTTTGKASIIAGIAGQAGSADGPGKAAQFRYPSGVANNAEKLYVADTLNHTIRVINKMTGAVTTLSGTAGERGSSNGIGSAARFSNPNGVVYDDGILYVVDSDNNTVRKIVIATGDVTTIAGKAGFTGSVDGRGSSARFNSPNGIAIEGENLYITDSNNCTIRKIDKKTGKVSTLAGTAGRYGATDGIGALAEFDSPRGIAIHGKNIYITDSGNTVVRKIEIAARKVTTFAGSAWSSGVTNGKGSAARFILPEDITSDDKYLYVTQLGNRIIRKIDFATGTVTSLPEIKR